MTVSITFHIIGLGVAQTAQLSEPALIALNNADSVLGSARQISVIENLLNNQDTHHFPKFSELSDWILRQQEMGNQEVVILASGDPLYFGIGRWFSQQYDQQQLRFYPAVSSIQAACHEIGLSLQDVDVISLHGRPLHSLRRHIKQNQSLVMLTDQKSGPSALVEECHRLGFDDGMIHVCEQLGYTDQKIRSFRLDDKNIASLSFDPLHVSIISTKKCKHFIPEFPGVPDSEFITDGENGKGMLTKREVRLTILTMLQPARHDVIWDIGAGCGSVAIELSLWQKHHKVLAIEHHPERLVCLNANKEKFGVAQNMTVISGRAPSVLNKLERPNKIFIGGSDGELAVLLNECWSSLPLKGVLVASAVTEDTKQLLMNFVNQRRNIEDSDFESTQILVSRAGELAGQLLYRPNLPVTIFKWVKNE